MTPPRWVDDPHAPGPLVDALAEAAAQDRAVEGGHVDEDFAERDYRGWLDGWWEG